MTIFKCKECGKILKEDKEYCISCQLEIEEIDKEEKKIFKRFRKIKKEWH